MDAARRVKGLNNGGSALVLITVSLVVLIAMAGLAIDLGYMYANKTRLQKAADAGALAGAGRLNGTGLVTYSNQTGARNGAKHFADPNFKDNTFTPNLDINTTNDPGGDIVLGNWNPRATPHFTPSGAPVNAVRVVARRTGDTGTGIGANTKFNLFLGKVAGFDTMGAAAAAVAWRPPRARTFFLVGKDTCDPAKSPVPITLTINDKSSSNMAWTSLLDPSSNTNDMLNFFCPADKLPFVEVCNLPKGQGIYTTGGVTNIFKSVELDFYDPNYDAGKKTFKVDAGGNFVLDKNGNKIVTSWDVIVPISELVDPTKQPGRQDVYGYAEIVITKACGSGGGNVCPSRGKITAPTGTCSGDEIVINSITCADCDHSNQPGAQPVLAQ